MVVSVIRTFRMIVTALMIGGGFLCALWVLSARMATAESYGYITGLAEVVDARTLRVGGQEVRLYGILVPDVARHCFSQAGSWACGVAARAALAHITQNHTISCDVVGFGVDRVAWGLCLRADGDIAAEMVRSGFALSNGIQGDAYVPLEAVARAARVGLWRDVPSTEVSNLNPVTAPRPITGLTGALPAPCRIKGVHLQGQRVAVHPDHPHYDTVSVQAIRGDMWFCSVDDALYAGFPLAGSP